MDSKPKVIIFTPLLDADGKPVVRVPLKGEWVIGPDGAERCDHPELWTEEHPIYKRHEEASQPDPMPEIIELRERNYLLLDILKEYVEADDMAHLELGGVGGEIREKAREVLKVLVKPKEKE